MATSGTINTTVVNTDSIITHAIRRCGLPPTSITSETIDVANQNLYLILLAMSNEGISLWLIENELIGLVENKAAYVLPNGTTDLLNVQVVTPSFSSGTETIAASSFTIELLGSEVLEGISFNIDSTVAGNTATLEKSNDGFSWEAVSTYNLDDLELDLNHWFALDPQPSATFFRLSGTGNFTLNNFRLINSTSSIPIFPYSRDDYFSLSNLGMKSSLPTNYYYQKLLNPQITLWPVPNTEDKYLSTVVQRQIQDVGLLTQSVEVPERWKEAIIWSLAVRLAFELPNVSPERLALVSAENNKALSQASIGETDGTALRFDVGIRIYTR